MREIQLTQDKVMLIDVEDYESITKHSWCASLSKAGRWYAQCTYKQNKLYAHRLIVNAKEGVLTDHRNGNTLDNRRCNLRVCSTIENARNKAMQRNNTSGHIGVSFDSSRCKWMAQIQISNRPRQHLHLGRFISFEEACAVYDEAAEHYFGEFKRGTSS